MPFSVVNRRQFMHLSGLAVAGLAACAPIQAPLPVEAPVTSPDEALERLLAGNQRYVANRSLPINESPQRRSELASGQNPFATVFSCVDSHVPPELVFDRGLGDLFTIRTAGQVIDEAVLGSIEFGVAELKIPLLLVMGHASCGAVKATLNAVEHPGGKLPGSIGYLAENIHAAVEAGLAQPGDPLANAVAINVQRVVERLLTSPVISAAVEGGTLKVVGSVYDLATGVVKMV